MLGGGAAENVFTPVSPLFHDAFTGTDNALLSSHTPAPTNTINAAWTGAADWIILSNSAKWAGATDHNIATIPAGQKDMLIEGKLIKPAGAAQSGGLVVRGKNSTNWNGLYLYDTGTPAAHIFQNVNGTFTSKANLPMTLTAGASYYCSVLAKGTTIMANVNGAMIKATGVTANQNETLAGLWGISAYMFNDFKFYNPSTNLIIFDGDSLTIGSGLTFLNTWPYLLHADFRQCMWANKGVSGYGLAEANADVATRVDPLFTSGYNNILFVYYGTNDLRRPITAAEHYASLQTYIAARRTAGANKVIGYTLQPAGDGAAISQGYEQKRQDFNTLMRNDHSFLDGLVEICNAPDIGAPGAFNNTTYYQADLLHYANAGAIKVHDLSRPVLQSAIV
jgi:hypothetical protein